MKKLIQKQMKVNSVSALIILLICSIPTIFAQQSFRPVNAYHNQGLIYLGEGNILEAEKLFYFSAIEFSYAPSFFELARIEFDKGTIYSRQKARDYIQKAIWKDPLNIEFRLLKAKLMEVFSSGLAYDEYEEILEIDPKNVEALYNLGRISEKEFYEYHKSVMNYESSQAISFDDYAYDSFFKAEKFLKKAIKIDPEHTDSYFHLATLYEETGAFENGIPLLKKIIKIDTLNEDAYLFLGYLYYKTLKFDSSQIAYKKALNLMTEDERKDFNLNTTLMLFGDGDVDQEQVGEIIENFWSTKDPLYLTEYNERLLEHYSRIAYSNIKFSVAKQNVMGWQSDRGEIMIRYGNPINRVRLRPYINAGGKTQLMLKTDVWVYNDKAFGFTDDYWTGDYRFSAPSNYGRYFSQYLYDTHTYVKYLRRADPEDYEPIFKGPVLKIPFNVIQFKDLNNEENRNTQIYINYALDVRNNFKFRNKYKIQHRCGLFLFDSSKNKLEQQIQEFTYLGNEKELMFNPREKFWINSLMMEAKPDSGTLAFEFIRKKDEAVSTNHFGLRIKDFNHLNLDISDIVLATKIGNTEFSEGYIVRNNLEILPNPTKKFTGQTDVYLYYELYNLEKDKTGKTNFEQRISLKKVDENSFLDDIFSSITTLFGSKSNDEFTFTTNYQSFEKNTQVYLQIDMSKYQPGDYILIVSVEDNISRKETSAETLISWR